MLNCMRTEVLGWRQGRLNAPHWTDSNFLLDHRMVASDAFLAQVLQARPLLIVTLCWPRSAGSWELRVTHAWHPVQACSMKYGATSP